MSAPRRLVTLLKLRRRTFTVGIVAQREHCTAYRVQQFRGALVLVRVASGYIARANEDYPILKRYRSGRRWLRRKGR
jgi:hypothetical protein